MDGKSKTRRERWRERTDAAYRRMVEGKGEGELVTLTQRESMAILIAREMAAFLLEEQVAMDKAATPESACCPKCGQPGAPAIQKEDELPERRVMTRAGDIGVRRQRWRCAKCRILFFSARRKARSGNGRVQSGAHPESGTSGGEVAVVRGSERRST